MLDLKLANPTSAECCSLVFSELRPDKKLRDFQQKWKYGVKHRFLKLRISNSAAKYKNWKADNSIFTVEKFDLARQRWLSVLAPQHFSYRHISCWHIFCSLKPYLAAKCLVLSQANLPHPRRLSWQSFLNLGLLKRCNWTDLSLIPGHSIGGRKKLLAHHLWGKHGSKCSV